MRVELVKNEYEGWWVIKYNNYIFKLKLEPYNEKHDFPFKEKVVFYDGCVAEQGKNILQTNLVNKNIYILINK